MFDYILKAVLQYGVHPHRQSWSLTESSFFKYPFSYQPISWACVVLAKVTANLPFVDRS